MLLMIAAALLAAGQTADDLPEIIEGRCDYPSDVKSAGGNNRQVPCDTVIISPSREPNSLLIQFATKRGSGSPIGFAGDVDQAGTLSIRRIYLTPGVPTQATRGHCKVFHNEAGVSGVTCVGFVGERATIANFRAFAP